MAVTYGFYNSKDHDRIYDANDFSSIFDGIINDGVFLSVGERFNVTPVEGLTVSVGSGRAWFNSTWTQNDANLLLELDPPDMVDGRIDAVVLEVNSETRTNSIKVVKGVIGATPVRPELTNSQSIHQYALAYVTVVANATSLAAADIQNVVGLGNTPYVTGILETADVDNLYSSWEERFNTWFEGVQGMLDGDVAVNLTASVDALQRMTAPIPQETKDYIGTEADTLRDLFVEQKSSSVESETIIIDDSSIVFINPNAKKLRVLCIGPGGDVYSYGYANGNTYQHSSYLYGSGAGDVSISELYRKDIENYIPVTVSNNLTSFGKYVSAGKGGNGVKHYGDVSTDGPGSSNGMGGAGDGGNGGTYGGGGGGGKGINGGNGGTYGGGGGGGGKGINGGNGGTYGGGGGSGGNTYSSTFSPTAPLVGIGGEYGGNGGTKYLDKTSGFSEIETSPIDGINTLSMNLLYTGEGLCGLNGNNSSFTTSSYINTKSCGGGGGGGGYGGNGGNGGNAINDSSYSLSGGGGGGGGYGGNGGNGGYSTNAQYGTDGGGGGGGGYGGNGGNGSASSYPSGGGGGGYGGNGEPGSIYGAGGGGYGSSNYGAGTHINSITGSQNTIVKEGRKGCVIIQLIYKKDS